MRHNEIKGEGVGEAALRVVDEGPVELQSPGVSHRAHVAPVVPRAALRIVDSCRCGRRHRNSTFFARCCWPDAKVSGSGQLAIVIECPEPRVVLAANLRWAHVLRAEFAVFGCGALCEGRHELVALDYDGPVAA